MYIGFVPVLGNQNLDHPPQGSPLHYRPQNGAAHGRALSSGQMRCCHPTEPHNICVPSTVESP